MSCRVWLLWLVAAGCAACALPGCDGLTFRSPPPPPPLAERQRRAAEAEARAKTEAQAEATPAERPSAVANRVGPPSPAILPYTEWSASEAAADALGRIGTAAVPRLSTLLHDEDPEVRQQAARILARIGPDAVAAVPDLIQLLQDKHPHVQRAAARALGQIGPEAADAVPALLQMLDQDAAGTAAEAAPPQR